jgi:hypothetical protein
MGTARGRETSVPAGTSNVLYSRLGGSESGFDFSGTVQDGAEYQHKYGSPMRRARQPKNRFRVRRAREGLKELVMAALWQLADHQ